MAASINDKFCKAQPNWTGQVGAAGVADGTVQTIPLASGSGLVTDTATYVGLERVNNDGDATPTKKEVAKIVVSGDSGTQAVRGKEGTAQAHSAGAVVEGLFTAAQWNDAIDGILVEHGQDGKHSKVNGNTVPAGTDTVALLTASQTLTNKTLTEPNLTTGSNIQVNGADPSRTIVLPAGSMSPTTTAGCAAVATVEAGTNDIDYKVLDFDKATEENAFIVFAMPDSWDGGTITATFLWTSTVTSGDVIWGIKGRAFANDDAIDQAYGTAVTVTDTAIASGDVHISSATGAMTFAGSPAGGQLVQLKIYRDADAAGDTADADARLIAIKIEYKVGQYSD